MSGTKLWYKQPAREWAEALPLGNGRIGAMVYGGVFNERICLNEDTLWSGYPKDHNIEGSSEYFKQAQELVQNKEYLEGQKVIEDHCLSSWGQAYMPLGDIEIEFKKHGEKYTNYRRELDLKRAIATTTYEINNVEYKREMFICGVNDVVVLKVGATKKGMLDLEIKLSSKLKANIQGENNCLIIDGECPSHADPSYAATENPIIYTDKEKEKGIGFRGILKVIHQGGTVKEKEATLLVDGADEVQIYFCVKTSFNGFNKLPYLEGKEYKIECYEQVERVLHKSYDEILEQHVTDYQKYFERVYLELEGENKEDLPTDERLYAFETNREDLSLYSLLFNFGRYLIISSSRPGTQPANLQGIWNSELLPPWSSNYTVNINTQMNYWPVLATNLVECNKPLIQMIREVRVNGEKTAKVHYNARGFTAHHNIDLWRMTTPVGNFGRGSASYSFWPMSAAWLCRHVFEHYEYTLDKEYLKNEAYPIMKDAALFCIDLLIKNEEGYWVACPSTSPENVFLINGERCAVAETTTMTMAIIKDLFKNCIKASHILDEDDEFRQELEEKLKVMLPYKVGSHGELLEWSSEFEESEMTHRHISHLYGLHPGNEITLEETPDIAEACKVTLIRRGDDGTGWSLGWKANQWARLREGNHALKLIDRQLKVVRTGQTSYSGGGGTYINMFGAHPPFQIDGNFGVTSGVVEMLMQSNEGKIMILPALPDKWDTGKVKGLLAKGNIQVDIEWEKGKLKELTLYSKINQVIQLVYKHIGKEVELQGGIKTTLTKVNMGG